MNVGAYNALYAREGLMANGQKLCMSCMNTVPAGASECPSCGYNGSQRNPGLCLPIGYRLANRYVVGRKLDEDSGSVSYVAYDMTRKSAVELREFLPHGGCTRGPDDFALHAKAGAELHFKTALMDFCELFRSLLKVGAAPSLIGTYDFFETNGTAYAALERFEGAVSLREFLTMSGGSLPFDKCMKLLSPVLDALEEIHSVNLIHRGVSPDTIFVNRNGDVKLGGFATSSVRTKDSEVASKMQSGYSAPEQYSTTAWQNTQTDVYGICATFYRCLTGATPQDAEQRKGYDTLEAPLELNPTIPQYASRAIMLGMLVNMDERTATVGELREMLSNRLASDPTRVIEPSEVNAAKKTVKKTEVRSGERKKSSSKKAPREDDDDDSAPKSSQTVRIIIVASVILAVLAGVYFVGKQLLESVERENAAPPSVNQLTVPNYTGIKLSDIVYDRDNFDYAYEYVTDNNVEDNVVISQAPLPDEPANAGDKITLYINKGEKSTKMIDVVGYSQANAEAKLKEAGIDYIVAQEQTNFYAAGIVSRQSIQEGVAINPETQTVTIFVSIGASGTTAAGAETPPAE